MSRTLCVYDCGMVSVGWRCTVLFCLAGRHELFLLSTAYFAIVLFNYDSLIVARFVYYEYFTVDMRMAWFK